MIDFPAARRLRDRLGLDLVACLANPQLVVTTFAQLNIPRIARRAHHTITGRRCWNARRAFIRVAGWVVDFYPKPDDSSDTAENGDGGSAGLHHGLQRIDDPWEFVSRLLGVVQHTGDGLTRELLHRFDGQTYQAFWVMYSGIAVYVNANSKRGAAPATFERWHPMHQGKAKPKPSGRAQVDHLAGMFMAMGAL